MEKVVSWFKSEFQPWFSNLFASEVTKIANAQAELAAVKAELSTAQGLITASGATIADLTSKLETATMTVAANAAEIAALKYSLETEKNRATEALASQGLSQERLPKGSTESGGAKSTQQQVEALRKKLSESKDPKEKYTLSNQIRELLSSKN